MKYLSVADVKQASPDAGRVDCVVTFEDDAGNIIGPVPFTASPDDVEAHGREIYQKAIAGEFGPVGAYVAPPPPAPPPQPTLSELQAQLAALQAQINELAGGN